MTESREFHCKWDAASLQGEAWIETILTIEYCVRRAEDHKYSIQIVTNLPQKTVSE